MPGRPFQPGDPRINRNGRPKLGQSLADLTRAFLKEEISVDDPADKRKGAKKKRQLKVVRARLFLEALYSRAVRGSDSAAKLLWNYNDGLPPFRAVIANEEPEGEPDLSRLSDEELMTVIGIMEKAKGNAVAPGKNGKNGSNGHRK